MNEPGPVPARLAAASEEISVERAWPHEVATCGTEAVISVEGRDQAGMIRAGRLRLRRDTQDGAWNSADTELADAGADPKLPDLADLSGQLLVHRFGKRAVVRREGDVVKVIRPGRASEIAERARQGRRIASDAGLMAPEVLRVDGGIVSFSVLPGRSLHDLGADTSLTEWSALWSRWAKAWPALTRGESTGLPVHTATHEAQALRRWSSLADEFAALPRTLLAGLHRAAERVMTDLIDGTAQPFVTSHRDLHDKQLLADGEHLGILDFDTAALAEPALDLANLSVHAALRVDQGLWPAQYGAVVRAAVDEVAGIVGVDRDRFGAYAEATRIRLACIYAFRPRYRELAIAWASTLDR
ncbi:phosphotransferase [Cumulibacter soli]|uniref:phosphotransferase n=1 Tax=Cumulibacter soli TaxID=2546344 RepID=UPI001067B761|nr:phosphotransferase [Cumulibacter soli]